METVTVKGKVYQLNTLYEFSDLGTSWHLETLENICDKGFFETYDERNEEGSSWKLCRSVSGELGTIIDAPIELEDGEWYMCDLISGPAVMQFKYSEWFYSDGNSFDVSRVDVFALHKMVKA